MGLSSYYLRFILALAFFVLFCLNNNNIYGGTNSALIIIHDYLKPVPLETEWKALRDDSLEFKEPAFDDTSWPLIKVPSASQITIPGKAGIVWYRLKIILPAQKPDYTLGLLLSHIDSSDETYINGHLIGKNGTMTPPYKEAYDKNRVYEIPAEYLIKYQYFVSPCQGTVSL